MAAVAGWVLWSLWDKEQITPDQWEPFTEPNIIELLYEGLVDTLVAAGVAIALAVAFGFALAGDADAAGNE